MLAPLRAVSPAPLPVCVPLSVVAVSVVAEMNDGMLYAVSKPVRVTISGCDLPPQS